MLAISTLLVLGASASIAAAGELSYDGATVVFDATDDLDHELQVRSNGGQDEFIDSQQFTTIPGDCTVVDPNSRISCPGHTEVRANFGAGNDSFTTEHSTEYDCFNVYTINMGEGSNDSNFSDACTDPATATITAGAGDDTLRGCSPTTSTTIFAGGGPDTLNGGEGVDVFHGGEGATSYSAPVGTTSSTARAATTRSRAPPATTSRTAARATTTSAGPSASAPLVTMTRAPTRFVAAMAPTNWCSRAT